MCFLSDNKIYPYTKLWPKEKEDLVLKVRKFFKIGTILAFLGLNTLAAYEAYALWDAEKRSGEVVAAALAIPQKLKLSDLSRQQLDILLAIEDPGFYDHSGVDFSSPGQGLTTITQGLVKFLYFDRFTPGFAKLEQILIARFVLNHHMSKEQQLAVFINQAYLGQINGVEIRGFAEGANIHFGLPFQLLSKDQYIGLVGMLIGPNELRPDKYKEALEQRVARIKAMLAGKCKAEGVLDAWYENCP